MKKVKDLSYNIDISQISQISEEVNSYILSLHEGILESRSEIYNYTCQILILVYIN